MLGDLQRDITAVVSRSNGQAIYGRACDVAKYGQGTAARLFRVKEPTSPDQPFREEDTEPLLVAARGPTPKVSVVYQLSVDEITFDTQKQKAPEQKTSG